MNIKTKLIHEYFNFVDNTKKQNKNLWIYNNAYIYSVYTYNIIIQIYK